MSNEVAYSRFVRPDVHEEVAMLEPCSAFVSTKQTVES